MSHINSPLPHLNIPAGTKALGFGLEATDMVAFGNGLKGVGLQPLAGAEMITRLEPCIRCYSTRPPYDPIVGVRRVDLINPTFARSAVFGIPLHKFTGADLSLYDLMKYQMGFIPAFEQVLGAENIRTTINGAGYVGSFFSSPNRPSLVYPYPSHVENLYHGGLWIGARRPDGSLGVSTSADQYSTAAAGEEAREFAPFGEPLRVISNIPTSDYYDATAVAPWQAECVFQDQIIIPGNHLPLGLTVHLRAMSWNTYPVDDAVVLEYRIVNTSAGDLRDVYVGFFADMTVGNTELNNPYGTTEPGTFGWNWYDDMNGAWRPGDITDEADLWMMWEHDADGDQGLATSWIGCCLLGTDHLAEPTAGRAPVSYNAEVFRDWPVTDDAAYDSVAGQFLPGRYQVLGNGDFDVGVTPDGDFSLASDWAGLLSTGPFPLLAAGDTLTVTFALVGGDDGWHLQRNGSRIQDLVDSGYVLDVSGVGNVVPSRSWLGAAHPNPFNPQTKIRFRLAQTGRTRLEVFTVDGRRVVTLLDEEQAAGEHAVVWSGTDMSGRAVASGHYLYRLEAPGGERLVGHMTLVK